MSDAVETAGYGSKGVMRYVILWFRIFYGAHLIYSAMRFFLGIEVLGRIHHPVARPFLDGLVITGIYPMVKSIELVTGLMILLNILVPLALVIEVPITVVIFVLNTFIVASNRQLFSGPQELFLNGILIVFYARYYMPLLVLRPPPRPLWTARKSDIRIP
jgi:hypothetical protein